MMQFDVERFRSFFPALGRKIGDFPLVYFDSAASSLTAKAVVETLSSFYLNNSANVHRGIHHLSEEATSAFEAVREKAKKHIGAASIDEICFTYGATDSMHLLTEGFAASVLKKNDKVVICESEHHANIVPWQLLQERIGFNIVKLPVDALGQVSLETYGQIMEEGGVKFVAISVQSNATGVRHPVKEITTIAHKQGAYAVVDAAQSVVHGPFDVQSLDADFLFFSTHKMYGPFGVGILYAKKDHMKAFTPVRGGGEMIDTVGFEGSTFAKAPRLLEAGTPNIAGVIAAGAAFDFVGQEIGQQSQDWERELALHGRENLEKIEGLSLLGEKDSKVPVFSFTLAGCHPHDLATLLNGFGIAVRSGHHCAQPMMDRIGVSGTTRASLMPYNTKEELDFFAAKLLQSRKILVGS